MKQLIINGDDFGLSEGVCAGILHCISQSGLSSISVLPCVDGSLDRLVKYRSRLPVSIGVHLQLTSGKPLAQADRIQTLLVRDEFPREVPDISRLRPEEVELEWRAQIEAVRDIFRGISHIDSHHGLHRLDDLADIYIRLAREYGLAARGGDRTFSLKLRKAGIATPDLCVSAWSKGELTTGRFLSLVSEAFSEIKHCGTVEIVTHPGFVDADLKSVSSYTTGRESELNVIVSHELREGLDKMAIAVTSFDRTII